jgi:hypothetical protein
MFLSPHEIRVFSVPRSQTLCLCSTLIIRDQLLFPYELGGKIVACTVLIHTFSDAIREGGRFLTHLHQTFLENQNY